MEKTYREIFKLAGPFLTVRENQLHTEVVYAYAQKLADFYGGNKQIIFPAAILHDVGYSVIPEEKIIQAFGPEGYDLELGRLHEVEGAKIAKGVLEQVSFPESLISEICRIIECHDSGWNPLTLEEKIVKDADKLFRFDIQGFGFATRFNCYGMQLEEYFKYLFNSMEGWFFTDNAKSMAKEGLEVIKRAYF